MYKKDRSKKETSRIVKVGVTFVSSREFYGSIKLSALPALLSVRILVREKPHFSYARSYAEVFAYKSIGKYMTHSYPYAL